MASRVKDCGDLLADPQARAMHLVSVCPTRGTPYVRPPGLPDLAAEAGSVPWCGEHGEEIRRELAATPGS
jgi:crotonobetainyl-CoA:carnitine CoA-transferase CaiB-like acyl-CoA transferase